MSRKAHDLAAEPGPRLQVCPLSNQALQYVEDMRNHPATVLLASGVPLTLSPDDPTPLGYPSVVTESARARTGTVQISRCAKRSDCLDVQSCS